MTDLMTTDSAQLKELVASLPPNKRAAFSKAAKAACQHLRDSKKNYAKAYDIASLMVENWWRLGQELPRLGISKGSGMRKRSLKVENVIGIEDLGISHNQSAMCQRLAEWSKAELEGWLEKEYDEDKYWLPSLRPASEGKSHVEHNSGENEWYTPPEIIEAARHAMSTIDLDPASSEVAQKWIKARKFYTLDDDGLRQPWAGNVWLNPPYAGTLVQKFAEKLLDHTSGGEVSQAIILVNNATETRWGQLLLSDAAAVCFASGRVKFIDKYGEVANTPLQGQCLCYFGRSATAFVKMFRPFGACLRGKR